MEVGDPCLIPLGMTVGTVSLRSALKNSWTQERSCVTCYSAAVSNLPNLSVSLSVSRAGVGYVGAVVGTFFFHT